MPTPNDLTPDAFTPWPVWREAMQQWEQRGGLAILQIHTACTEDEKGFVRAFLEEYQAWLNRPAWER
jgi:cytosine/adenosine deaminase-related metal-dependent hydrolase